jgi:AcrR family transcriptional regulator
MKVRLGRRERTAATRRRLLDAARRVFIRRGYHGASLELVAEEAGFTKGAVYSRFRSKADLFLAVLAERIEARIAEMRAAAASARGPLALATVLSRQWDRKLREDEQWSLLLIEFRLHAARVPALNRRYAALHTRLRDAMAQAIAREAVETGEVLTTPAADVARAALALGTGAVLERAADGTAFPPHLVETMNRAIVQGLAVEAASTSPRRTRRIAS